MSLAIKPLRLPRMRPSVHQRPSIRNFSLPEDSPSVVEKHELDVVQRVVSMPEQRNWGGHLADSSLSTEGFDGSMLSGGSFVSATDTTSDSVLIIENNCGLSDAFLSTQSMSKAASSPLPKDASPNDEGWITWARSPPRPIPALHGPLSLPYARCPSGAEGTIIEEPDNLPRMIWGLGSGEQVTNGSDPDSHAKKQNVTTTAPQILHRSPHRRKTSNDFQAAPVVHSRPSAITARSPQRPRADDVGRASLGHATPMEDRTEFVYSRNPYNDTIVLENLVNGKSPGTVYEPRGYDAVGALGTSLEHGLHLREPGSELSGALELDYSSRNLLSRVYGSRNQPSSNRSSSTGVPAMRVSSRPAVGSALPQIFIEPRSPEVPQLPSRRMTAMEIAQQYQYQQLLKMQHQNMLPTPPNSSSPQWSSEFSPYDRHTTSPPSLRQQTIQEQLRNLEMPDNLRHLVRDRYGRNVLQDVDIPQLAPAAQINSTSRMDYPSDYDFDPVSSQALMNLLATRDMQRMPSLPADGLSSIGYAPQTAAEYLGRDLRQYATAHHESLFSPSTSPEGHRHTRGHSQHQVPRSIPLARLMQRRLSVVTEEESSPTIHGRSPSPPQHVKRGMDRSYLHSVNQHGYQYSDALDQPVDYPAVSMGPTARDTQPRVRVPTVNGRSPAVNTEAIEAQRPYRVRREGTLDREGAAAPKRTGNMRRFRGRPTRIHAN
ncbi:hypothetical protein BC834DRAFT_1032521 [Gloeopeniophorella convolvens]|nr:hypothetical protein BC834DRAFT_1032521 [Gloeopeniophorella convolvens]